MPPEPEATDQPRGHRSWHKLEFSVHGNDFAEIDKKAMTVCDAYFGDVKYKYMIETHATMHNDEVIGVHGNVTANYLLTKDEQHALFQQDDF